MFKLVRIEVLGYKDFIYKLGFEGSDVKYVYDKFGLNARECLVSGIDDGYSITVEVGKDQLVNIINILEDIVVRLFLWTKNKVVVVIILDAELMEVLNILIMNLCWIFIKLLLLINL
ncbi:MAG: hypothetical protein ACK5HR_07455 [Mycoplasmatales bacterium]